MNASFRIVLSFVLLAAFAGTVAFAQEMPSTQPNVLLIQIEKIKIGHDAAHAMTEAGWPRAYDKANASYPYLALARITGTSEVWYVSPYDSYQDMEAAGQADAANAELSAELARLSLADSEHVSSLEQLHAVARKDLSHGSFPDIAKQRFWQITTFRVPPGRDAAFAGAAKAYGAAAGRVAPDASFRVYEVAAGGKNTEYFVFSSTTSMGAFDKVAENDAAIFGALNAEEQKAMAAFTAAGIEMEVHRFRLAPEMSYVPRAVREQDPTFWTSPSGR